MNLKHGSHAVAYSPTPPTLPPVPRQVSSTSTRRGLTPILLSSIIFCLDLNTSNLISTPIYVTPNLIDAKNLEQEKLEHILL